MGRFRQLKTYITVVLAAAAVTVPTLSLLAQISDPALDLRNLDMNTPACLDFYQFANGGWIAGNPVPAAYPFWGSFNELQNRTDEALRDLLTEATQHPLGSTEQKVGLFYTTCVQADAVEQRGAAPLVATLTNLDAITDQSGLQAEIARLHDEGLTPLFSLRTAPDPQDSSTAIAHLSPDGLGLPDRNYYTRTDEASEQTRRAYVAHICRSFILLGVPDGEARKDANIVLSIETQLAQASMSLVDQRNPDQVTHLMKLTDLQALTPRFDWSAYCQRRGISTLTHLNVRQPAFFQAVDTLLDRVPLAEWPVYLKWQLVLRALPYLSDAFVEEQQRMNQVVEGSKELLPRWKRCVAHTQTLLGQAAGQLYAHHSLSAEAKQRALTLVGNVKAALRASIEKLDWLSEPTRMQALAKLDALVEKVGYPDRWLDYTSLMMSEGSFYDNVIRAATFATRRDVAMIGKPVDRTEWVLPPTLVNAYYDAAQNEIVVPAGILQPPLFNIAADDAVNYGSIGAVIGHELSHGFSDRGRQYDAKGNQRDWWTPEDTARFSARAKSVAQQFDSSPVTVGFRVNGELTLGENLADFAGLTVAYRALEETLRGKLADKRDGFTPEQRFFLGWAQVWCWNVRPEALRAMVLTNAHAPNNWRVNGPLANMPAFAQAFGCQPSDPMVRAENERARIW
ncbi:MAG: M13 family metallopeptidase [Deltaproteobacteria bacterium]|nr:M13 family metallopeptidase [Deltaproteobacteria bacterium]